MERWRRQTALACALLSGGGAAYADWSVVSFGPRLTNGTLEWTIPEPTSSRCSIAGNWAISELRWDPILVGAQIQVLGISQKEPLIVDLRGALSRIVGGLSSDKDWDGPNYGMLNSHTLSHVGGWEGESLVSVGYRWSCPAIGITPLVGWQFRRIVFKEYGLYAVYQAWYGDVEWLQNRDNGVLTYVQGDFSACVASGWDYPPEHLISTYGGTLSGATVGLSLWAWPEWEWPKSQSPMSLRLEGWVGLAEWKAEADWCLRDQFAHPLSFSHHCHMLTAAVSQQVRLRLTPRWNLDLQVAADWAWGPEGDETLYKADGRVLKLLVADTRWQRVLMSLQAGYIF